MHEQVLLGDSLEVIMAETNSRIPTVSEYQFKREVLGLLRDPFNKHSLSHYEVYVGELTRQLRVVEDGNPNNVLFTIPALVQSPRPSMATPGGYSAENFFRSLTRDIDLGGAGIDQKIVNFLNGVTQAPNVIDVVLKPIREILHRYGTDFVQVAPDGVNHAAAEQLLGTTRTTSSFDDDGYAD
jgi:hypothetical protein